MKSLSILASAALVFSLSACSEVSAQSGSTKQLSHQVDSLSKELATLKADFDVLKYGLEKRGISIDEIRIEMEQLIKFGIFQMPKALFLETQRIQNSLLLNSLSFNALIAVM